MLFCLSRYILRLFFCCFTHKSGLLFKFVWICMDLYGFVWFEFILFKFINLKKSSSASLPNTASPNIENENNETFLCLSKTLYFLFKKILILSKIVHDLFKVIHCTLQTNFRFGSSVIEIKCV